ncbi:MAG: hypothetical protein V1871_01030 [Planctomycetota bacterium]
MKKIEINRVGVLSTWKVTTYMMIFPAVLCFLMGIAFVVIGIVVGQKQMWIMGIIMGVGYPVALTVIYGPMMMLMALIYNWLAGKFGGLELTIKEEEPTQPG